MAQNSELHLEPFALSHGNLATEPSPADVSFLLDAPAGRHGFVRVKDGHLVTTDNGRRIRFWGVNITDWSPGSQQIPSKSEAPRVAATLARFGVNCARLEFLDFQVPRGMIKNGPNTKTLDPEALDREDFFIAELERRGIYIYLSLLVGRPFQTGDDVADAPQLREGAKGVSLFDQRLIELQKDYARELLTHRNPYTQRRYTADPGVAVVEINNENAINIGFRLPSLFYTEELTTLYNAWLQKHRSSDEIGQLHTLTHTAGGRPVPLLRSVRVAAQSPSLRFDAESEFFDDLQSSYFKDMEHFLKQDLGGKWLVIATADHNHSASGYPILHAEQAMDIMDGHTYWQHPGSYVHKLPMVDDPANSTVAELSRSAVAGRPYTVSEVNEPFPNDYGSEEIPILAAYGSFQDWDGIFWYTFEPKPDPTAPAYIGDPFDISRDPVKMPELAAGALLFLRGDVAPARQTVLRSYSERQVVDSTLLPESDRPYFTPGFPPLLALQHEIRIGSLDGPPTGPIHFAQPSDPIVSDTAQLFWYLSAAGEGSVEVRSPRSESIIGFPNAHAEKNGHLSAKLQNRFYSLQLTSLDGLPIESSRRMLLVAGGTVRNTGQVWNPVGTDVVNWGQAPTLVDTLRGEIKLRGLEHARAVHLQPLDGAGKPLSKPIVAMGGGATTWTVPIGEQPTTWYEVEVDR